MGWREETCRYNEYITVKDPTTGAYMPRQIVCYEGNCKTCGWNPAVERERKEKIREMRKKGVGKNGNEVNQ